MGDGGDQAEAVQEQIHNHNDAAHGLDPQLHLDPTATNDTPPHVIDIESHDSYPQMDTDDHDHNHVTFFDGSAMIHAAFAAQAIELAEKEREEADRHNSHPEHNGGTGDGDSGFDQFDFRSGSQTTEGLNTASTLLEEELQRPTKRRKTASGSIKKTKTKGTSANEHELERSAPERSSASVHNAWPREVSADTQPDFAPPDSASKRQSPADTATRKQSHITAEQKCRAAIKSGYEALYRVIPALRDAELKEGKGRGGSGPGGGGARSTRTGRLPGDGVNGHDSVLPVDTKLSSARRGRQARGESAGKHSETPDIAHVLHPKSYPHGQQYDEHGKPIRPGVLSILPLVRQPGSEVTDGRQGPRSESVVLQQTVLYLRQEQAHRLALMQRLRSLRRLGKRTLPEEEYGRLGLGPRKIEVEGHSMATSLDVVDKRRARGTWIANRESPYTPEADVMTPLPSGFNLRIDQGSHESSRLMNTGDAQNSLDTNRRPSPPLTDQRDRAVEEEPRSLKASEPMIAVDLADGVRGSDYPATLEAALNEDYHILKRVEELSSGTPSNEAPYYAEGRGAREPYNSTLEGQPEGHDPPNDQTTSRQSVTIDWEGEWSGGAFVEAEDFDQ